YDANGNLLQYTLADGTPVSIIWGYNGQYPIAKVEGVGFQAIEDDIDNFHLVTLSDADDDTGLGIGNDCSESILRKALSDFRHTGTFNGVAAVNVMVTTYTYDPLIGVTSITAPNGQTEYFEYDNAGRLIKVKDHEGKELKKSDYHYYNQP